MQQRQLTDRFGVSVFQPVRLCGIIPGHPRPTVWRRVQCAAPRWL